MATMLPPSRPKITRDEVLADLRACPQYDPAKHPIIAVGYRGYYLKSMGKPDKNDRSIYDDAFCLITPNEFRAFNANTDPSTPENTVTGRASLVPGFYPMWCLDFHKGKYRAFCQRLASCIVKRDGTEKYKKGARHAEWGECLGNGLWRGYFGINGHLGGIGTTSSLGCQTLPDPQWTECINLTIKEAKRLWGSEWDKRVIPYLLIDKAAPALAMAA
jgi:hypothetical protein